MGVEHAISMARNKALKDLTNALEGPLDYCWQEETADEARVSQARMVLQSLRAEEDRIRKKYRK